MNTKEKYDSIITTIENMVHDYDYDEDRRFSDDEIVKKSFEAGNASYMNDKVKCGMFAFMTNHTPKNYIAERRMMLVYQRLITEENFSYNEAYWLSGVDSQKGFIDKFKRVFAITPDVAKKQRDVTQLLPPKTWDLISDNFAQQMCEISFDNSSEKRFGLDLDKYTNAIIATNLMDYYGLNQLEADIAFEIAENNSLDFESVFEYVYGYVWQYIDPLPEYEDDVGNIFNAHPDPETRDVKLKEDLTNPEVINLYFRCNLGFSDILDSLYLKATGHIDIPLTDIDEDHICRFLDEYWYDIGKYEENDGQLEDEDYYDDEPYYHEWNYEGEEEFDYYESLDEDDPERVEFEMSLTEPIDDSGDWDQSWDDEQEYDLDNKIYYEELCKEVEQGKAKYRGNIHKMIPIGQHNLDVDRKVKDDLINELFIDSIGNRCLKDEENLDEYEKKLINRSKYSYQDLRKHFLERENLSEEEYKQIKLLELKEAEEWRERARRENERIRAEEQKAKEKLHAEAEERRKRYEEMCRRSRLIDSRMKSIETGTVLHHKKLGLCKIIEFRDSRVALIEYPDGHQGLVDIRGCFENGHISLDEEK